MIFHPEGFRQAVSDNNTKGILAVLTKLIYSLHHQNQPLFLVRLTEEISGILKSQSQSPVLKFKSVKILMYLIIMGDPQVIQLMGDQIYPIIRNACLYNRFHPLAARGMDFFRSNKYYEIATFDQKSKIKNIGCKYIVFCLECVYILSQWLPKEGSNTKQSIFLNSYKMLLKQGVQFPRVEQLSFFSADRVRRIQQELKICTMQADQLSEDIDDDYFQSGRSKFDAAVMNGVEYLQKKLRQKEKIISEMKYSNSVSEFQKQSVVVRMQDQEHHHNTKVEVYERKIADLTEEVRKMKELVKGEQNKSPEKQAKEKEVIASLQAKIQLLNFQNSQLKEELAKKSSVIGSYVEQSHSSRTLPSPNAKSQKYIKQLLQICQQQPEYSPRLNKNMSPKHSFYQYKDPKAPFYPFYDLLQSEFKIRFRKCLLKSKEILFKNRDIEIGILTSLKDQIEIEMTLILTNLSEKNIIVQDISFHFTKELPVVRQNSNYGKKKIKASEQFKLEIRAIVNSIDGRCPNLIVQYQKELEEPEELSLLLPVSKIKLMETLPFTSHSNKEWLQFQRVITIQKKILSNPNKLKDYWSRCFVQQHGENKQYCFKIKLLDTILFLRLKPIGDDSLRIVISFLEESKCLAEKLMNELQFILAK